MGAVYLDGGLTAARRWPSGCSARRSTTPSSTRASTTSRGCRSGRRRCCRRRRVYAVVGEEGPGPRQALRGRAAARRARVRRAPSGGRRRRPSRARPPQALARARGRRRAAVSDADAPRIDVAPDPRRRAGGLPRACATPGTRRTWWAAACATCCSAGRPPTSTSPPTRGPRRCWSCSAHAFAIPTGLKHGTVTVLTGRRRARHVEVTTFRGEGAYLDGRRPSSVTYVKSLDEDLAPARLHHERRRLRSARRRG